MRAAFPIALGFALLKTAAGEIDLVDMPGHERFVRAMISGATGMRAVLLAVAANEGVKPQTIEHLEIARLIGVRRGIVAITKCDLVDADAARRTAAAVQSRVAAAGIEAEVVFTSATTGHGLAELAQALARLLTTGARPPDDGFAYMPIDRVFARAGFGAIVTGTLRRGGLAVGDEVEIVPTGRRARIRALQIHGRKAANAEPGRRTAVNLRGVDTADLGRGFALTTPGTLLASDWLDVSLRVVASAPRPLASGERLRLLVGTSEVGVRLRLLDREKLDAGDGALAQLRCETPVAVPAREPFILRLDTPPATVGGGHVLDPASRRRRRHDAATLAHLGELASGQPTRALLARLRSAGTAGAAVADLARLVGTAPDRLARRLVEIGARPKEGERMVGPEIWDDLRGRALGALDHHHGAHPMSPGLSAPQLFAAMPAGTDPAVGAAAVRALAAEGALAQQRGLYCRAGFDPSRHAHAGTGRIEAMFSAAGLRPPDEADVTGHDPGRREIVSHLVRTGVLVRAPDRVQKRSVLFHRNAIAAAKTAIAGALGSPHGFLAGEAGALLGISRKFSIPLLEHLDGVRFHPPERRPAHRDRAGKRAWNRERRRGDECWTGRAPRGHSPPRGGDRGLVALLVFKTSGPLAAGGGFDSHPPPPRQAPLQRSPVISRRISRVFFHPLPMNADERIFGRARHAQQLVDAVELRARVPAGVPRPHPPDEMIAHRHDAARRFGDIGEFTLGRALVENAVENRQRLLGERGERAHGATPIRLEAPGSRAASRGGRLSGLAKRK